MPARVVVFLAGCHTWLPIPRDPLDSHHYKCAGDTTPKVSLSQDNKKIILQGLIFDKRAVLGFPVTYPRYRHGRSDRTYYKFGIDCYRKCASKFAAVSADTQRTKIRVI